MGLLFTLLMTYGGSVVALFRPYYGFLIYVAFSIMRPESLWHWSVPPGSYSRTIAIALLIGWLLNGCGNIALGTAWRPMIALAGFWIWAAVSTFFCEYPQDGMRFLENIIKIILPAFAGLTLITSRRDIHLLSWTIVASQGYVAWDLNMSYFSGFNRLQEVGFGGMDNNSLTIGLVTGVGFSFFLALSEPVWWSRWIAYLAAAFMTHAVFFSFSRGGMLGLCVVGAASLYLIPKSPKNLGLMFLGFVAAALMAGPEVLDRFGTITQNSLAKGDDSNVEESAESRIHLWKICLQMTAESPLVGVGPDHFINYVQNYPIDTPKGQIIYPKGKEAHTLWLQIAAELGIPGVLFLAAYYGLTIKLLWRFTKYDKADSQGLTPGATARMVAAALVGFVVSAQFVSLEGLELPYYVGIVGLGCLKLDGLYPAEQSEAEEPEGVNSLV